MTLHQGRHLYQGSNKEVNILCQQSGGHDFLQTMPHYMPHDYSHVDLSPGLSTVEESVITNKNLTVSKGFPFVGQCMNTESMEIMICQMRFAGVLSSPFSNLNSI